MSPPPLVDSTDVLSQYIRIYIDVRTFKMFWPPGGPTLRANVASRIRNRVSQAESAFGYLL